MKSPSCLVAPAVIAMASLAPGAEPEDGVVRLRPFPMEAPLISQMRLSIWVQGSPELIPAVLELAYDERGRIVPGGPCTVGGRPVNVKGSLRPSPDGYRYRFSATSLPGDADDVRVTIASVKEHPDHADVSYLGPEGRRPSGLVPVQLEERVAVSGGRLRPVVLPGGRIEGTGILHGGFRGDMEATLRGRLGQSGDLRLLLTSGKNRMAFRGTRQPSGSFLGTLRYAIPPERGTVEGYIMPDVLTPPTGEDRALYGVDAGSDSLYTVDLDGSTEMIGPLCWRPDVFTTPVALAVRPADGEIFVWNNSGASLVTGELLTVDPCSGGALRVDPKTPPQGQMGALAFRGERLFGAGPTGVCEIDPVTGVRTALGSGHDYYAMDCGPDGILYGVTAFGHLYTFDIDRGVESSVGPLSVSIGVIGAVIFDGSVLIGTGFSGPLGSILFEIDPATARVSSVRATDLAAQGLGFAPSCR